MDTGVQDRCDFEQKPSKREWVTDDPDTIEPPEEEVTCTRPPVDDADYCAFHLSKQEQEARDIDTGARLRRKLEEVAGGKPPTDKNTDFRGAYLTAANLNGLDFGAMKGFNIDLRYADIGANVNLNCLRFDGKIDCRFVRCDSVTAVGDGEIGILDCSEVTLRNRLPTSTGSDERAFSLRRSASFNKILLTGADIAGDVFINDVTVNGKIDGESLTVEGEFNITTDAAKCKISGTIDDELIIEGGHIETLDCSSTVTESAVLQNLQMAEGSTGRQYTIECGAIDADSLTFQDVTTDKLKAKSLSVNTLKLEDTTVNETARLDRDGDVPSVLTRLRVTRCEFHGETRFDRLKPSTAFFDLDRATGDVFFRHFECQDTTFNPDGYPMFDGSVDFTEADLEAAILREFNAKGRAIFTNTDLTEARLLNADLSGAVLEGALLSRARLIGAKLNDAYLYHAALSDASIDMSTEFGERVIYDPESSEEYDPSLGLDAVEEIQASSDDAAASTADESLSTEAAEQRADGGLETEQASKATTVASSPAVPRPQKAKEVYHSIHNSARQSGDSTTAIETYRKRQKMETELLKRGHVRDVGWLRRWLQLCGRLFYGFVTGYGVGTRNILTTSLFIILLSLGGLIGASGGESNAPLYFVGGFVGTVPGIETTPIITLIIGIETLAGALLIAFYINALGRRSSM